MSSQPEQLESVRVSDRDAGGSEIATVAATHPRAECPPAFPISPIGSQAWPPGATVVKTAQMHPQRAT